MNWAHALLRRVREWDAECRLRRGDGWEPLGEFPFAWQLILRSVLPKNCQCHGHAGAWVRWPARGAKLAEVIRLAEALEGYRLPLLDPLEAYRTAGYAPQLGEFAERLHSLRSLTAAEIEAELVLRALADDGTEAPPRTTCRVCQRRAVPGKSVCRMHGGV